MLMKNEATVAQLEKAQAYHEIQVGPSLVEMLEPPFRSHLYSIDMLP